MEMCKSIMLLVNLGVPPWVPGIVQVKALIALFTWYVVKI